MDIVCFCHDALYDIISTYCNTTMVEFDIRSKYRCFDFL